MAHAVTPGRNRVEAAEIFGSPIESVSDEVYLVMRMRFPLSSQVPQQRAFRHLGKDAGGHSHPGICVELGDNYAVWHPEHRNRRTAKMTNALDFAFDSDIIGETCILIENLKLQAVMERFHAIANFSAALENAWAM
ncbi:hypothetical protein M434DRAFT_38369 [Hypoxylon sp. CO27-5]|nr:hypothetical protein M434DRAFT_38369 [Hypoxylon sp. CO27-5]